MGSKRTQSGRRQEKRKRKQSRGTNGAETEDRRELTVPVTLWMWVTKPSPAPPALSCALFRTVPGDIPGSHIPFSCHFLSFMISPFWKRTDQSLCKKCLNVGMSDVFPRLERDCAFFGKNTMAVMPCLSQSVVSRAT